MPKKTNKPKEKKLLTPAEVAQYKPDDPIDKVNAVMGFGLQSAYDLMTKPSEPSKVPHQDVLVAERKAPEIKAGNVDALPEPVKRKK